MQKMVTQELKDCPINRECNPFLLSNISKLVPENTELIIKHDNSRKIRLQSTRFNLFYEGIDNDYLINQAVPQYLKWVKQSEYLIFGEYNPVEGFTKYWASLASKRGNSKYGQRLSTRYKFLKELPDIQFFNYKDRSQRQNTRGLFITLTYDPKNLTIGEAWKQVGSDYNRFITAFRKRYGETSVLRVWEAQQSGYPHIHILAIAEKSQFSAFHHGDAWRVEEKRDIEILWKHGYSDVEALSSTKGGMVYISKYLGKLHTIGVQVPEEEYSAVDDTCLSNLVSRASVLTLSMMWLFRKRAFSISGGLSDLIRDLHNSNLEPEKVPFELLQLDLEGGAEPEYVKKVLLLGFWGGKLLKGSQYPKWSVQLNASQVREIKYSHSWNENRHLNK